MGDYQKDLNNNILIKEEEINFLYEGDSFKDKMEISSLTSQLEATEKIIRDLVSEMYKQKKLKNPDKTEIYIKLKRGSFHEIISIIFNQPVIAEVIGTMIVGLIGYFLNKNGVNINNYVIDIGNVVKNYKVVKNINNLIDPLGKESDKLKINSSNSRINTEISFNEKGKIKEYLKELKEEVAIQFREEEFFGYLSVLDLDKGKYKFTLEESDKLIPTEFDNKPTLEEIKKLLGFRLKINARATYEEDNLKKIEIKDYEIKKRKNLTDFGV